MGLTYRGQYRDSGLVELEFETLDATLEKHARDIADLADGYTDITVDAISRTLTTADAGTVITNDGATAPVIYSLPTADTGMVLTFYVAEAQLMAIQAYLGDTIRIAGNVTATSGNISSDVVGSALTLIAINDTEWVALSSVGSWVF